MVGRTDEIMQNAVSRVDSRFFCGHIWVCSVVVIKCLNQNGRLQTRKFLRACETCTVRTSNVGGCLAWQIPVAMNSLRCSDQLGLIGTMKSFMKQQALPLSLITRFRGNCLHVIFHLCAIFPFLGSVNYLPWLSSMNRMISRLQEVFMEEAAIKMQVLGIIGKILTEPGVSIIYTTQNIQKDPH